MTDLPSSGPFFATLAAILCNSRHAPQAGHVCADCLSAIETLQEPLLDLTMTAWSLATPDEPTGPPDADTLDYILFCANEHLAPTLKDLEQATQLVKEQK